MVSFVDTDGTVTNRKSLTATQKKEYKKHHKGNELPTKKQKNSFIDPKWSFRANPPLSLVYIYDSKPQCKSFYGRYPHSKWNQ